MQYLILFRAHAVIYTNEGQVICQRGNLRRVQQSESSRALAKICVAGTGDFGERLRALALLSSPLLGMMVIPVFGLPYCKACIVPSKHDKGRLIVRLPVEHLVLLETIPIHIDLGQLNLVCFNEIW